MTHPLLITAAALALAFVYPTVDVEQMALAI